MQIRLLTQYDHPVIHEIINQAAEAYRGVIPADRWHDPYMSTEELQREIDAGVEFIGCEHDGTIVGVMGVQPVKDVVLIRHAYVRPEMQRHGIGRILLEHLLKLATTPVLIGTWASAEWAIRFYEKQGFELVPPHEAASLLRKYWTIPERQIETSVVLRARSC